MLAPLILVAATTFPGAEMRVEKNIPYSSDTSDRGRMLDVYAPADAKNAPVVVWIHGGAWKIGDKRGVNEKPSAFTAKGMLLASINYRLVPGATVEQQGEDVAAAIAYVRENAAKWGGSGTVTFVMGHSAGAHLAALVSTDPRYLAKHALKPADLSGTILLDGAGYDVPTTMRTARLLTRKLYEEPFGKDEARQRKLSPITYAKPGGRYPPFVILHVANRAASRQQSHALAAKLKAAGGSASVHAAEGKTHATINRELGRPNDPPTKVVFDFVDARLAAFEK